LMAPGCRRPSAQSLEGACHVTEHVKTEIAYGVMTQYSDLLPEGLSVEE
jgi:hypothetical protein